MKLSNIAKEIILLNEGRTKPLSMSEMGDILLKHCKDYVHNHKSWFPLWRGRKNPSYDIGYVDPTLIKRSSRDNQDYYNLILDNAPNWRNYPKRSQSLICTTQKSNAKTYGEVFFVIPFDNPTIGVCPQFDLWWSFPRLKHVGIRNLEDLETFLEHINYLCFGGLGSALQLDDSSYNSLVRDLERINQKKEILKKKRDEWFYLSLKPAFNNYLESDKSLLEWLMELLDPDKNGFKIVNDPRNIPLEVEAWTDSKAILVHENIEKSKEYKEYIRSLA